LGTSIYKNRQHAGLVLAQKLKLYFREHPIVIALPRGGVPVAAEIAKAGNLSLDILGVKKIGSPTNPEYAIGAVAEDGSVVINPDVTVDIDDLVQSKLKEAKLQAQILRSNRSLTILSGKTVIVVDDGLATGMTALAAAATIKKQGAKRAVFAAPVCAEETAELLNQTYDLVVCGLCPADFTSVGNWYEDFSQVSDREVVNLLSSFHYN
jgi:putative phosphoribosyl transferase